MSGRPSDGRGRKRRLSRSAEFERVYRQGRSKANRFLVLYEFARSDDAVSSEPRLGLSVSKRVGGSVERSRLKRVLREAFRLEAACLPTDTDYVVVARPAVRELDERDGMAGVRAALAELVEALSSRRRRSGSE